MYVQIFDKEQNFLQGTFTTKVSAQYFIIYGNFIQKSYEAEQKSIEFQYIGYLHLCRELLALLTPSLMCVCVFAHKILLSDVDNSPCTYEKVS